MSKLLQNFLNCKCGERIKGVSKPLLSRQLYSRIKLKQLLKGIIIIIKDE